MPPGDSATKASLAYLATLRSVRFSNATRLAGVELMPDNSEETARVLCIAGSWMKGKDPNEADRFYKELVIRCPKTKLGQEAEKLRWFPKVEIDRKQWPRHGKAAARTDKIAQPSLPNPNRQDAASTGPAEPWQFRIDDSLTPA